MASEMDEEFPTDLAGFGYEFKDGKLKNIKTGEPFVFVVREDDPSYNQKHYEALGEVITKEVYKLLESECNLKRSPIPVGASKNEPSTFIFLSEDALENADRLLVLIHGSGVVRAGQWARRLIINGSLDWGTQIPFIKEAQKLGYGILVLNTNDNSCTIKGSHKRQKIKGSSSPEEHACYVWKKFVHKAKAKHIALIAHSYGGYVTTELFQEEKKDFVKRVFAVAMTDSVHYIAKPDAFKALVKISRNWVSSSHPLDTPLADKRGDIAKVSSGVNVHEKTSYASMESVFKFLEARYSAATKGDGKHAEEESGALGGRGGGGGGGGACSQEESIDRKMSIGSDCCDMDDENKAKVAAAVDHQMSDSESEGDPLEKKEGNKDDGTLERAMSIGNEGVVADGNEDNKENKKQKMD